MNTDFGSGYRGIMRLTPILEKWLKSYNFVAQYSKLSDFANIAKEIKYLEIGDVRPSVLRRLFSAGSEKQFGKLKKETYSAIREVVHAGKAAREQGQKGMILIRSKATTEGVRQLKSYIHHERTHSLIANLNATKGLESLDRPLGNIILRHQLKELGYKAKHINEEVIAHTFQEMRYPGSTGLSIKEADKVRAIGFIKERFSGFDDPYNTIPGLKHGGMASWLRRMFTDFGSGYTGLIKALRAGTTASARTLFPEATEILFKHEIKGGALEYSIQAMRGKEEIFSAARRITEDQKLIELRNIAISGKDIAGTGRFSRWAQIEQDIFQAQNLGGWTLESMAISSITARKYAKIYGARAEVVGSTLITGKIPVNKTIMATQQTKAMQLVSTAGLKGGQGHKIPANRSRF